MTIDWNSEKAQAGTQNNKMYAPEGEYSLKIKDVTTRKNNKTETVWLDFELEESEEFRFPKISHPLSFKNNGWRHWHFHDLLTFFGIDDKEAKRLIEEAEKGDKDKTVQAYERLFRSKAIGRTVSVKVETEYNSRLSRSFQRADFNSDVSMSFRDKDTRTDIEESDTGDTGLEGAEKIEVTDLPF